MQVTVNMLKPFSDAVGKKQLALDFGGGTVGELLAHLADEYPRLKKEVYSEEGEVTDYLVIMVNDRPLSALNDMDTRLSDGDELLFFFPIAGG